VLLFALVVDYSENVELDHTIPEGFSIKFPHSKRMKRHPKSGDGAFRRARMVLESPVSVFFLGNNKVAKEIRFRIQICAGQVSP
jgi:hypothetical protein